ncbi:MAG: SCO family protein, partial [Oleibacter sp.]|nr:SCO family protein [Thalassolituus sp.]
MKYKFLSLGLLLVLLLIALVSGVFQASSSKTPVQQLKHITGVQMFSGPVLPDVSFTDQAGDVRLIKGLQGKWTLLFFGYTYCPDVCPTTLLTLGQVWKTLSPE